MVLFLLENRDFLGFRMIFKVRLNQIFSNFNTMRCTMKYRLSSIMVKLTFTVHELWPFFSQKIWNVGVSVITRSTFSSFIYLFTYFEHRLIKSECKVYMYRCRPTIYGLQYIYEFELCHIFCTAQAYGWHLSYSFQVLYRKCDINVL